MEGIIYYDKQNREVRTYNPGGEYKAYVSAEKAVELSNKIEKHVKMGLRASSIVMVREMELKMYRKMWMMCVVIMVMIGVNEWAFGGNMWINLVIGGLYMLYCMVEYAIMAVNSAAMGRYYDKCEEGLVKEIMEMKEEGVGG